MIKRVLLIWELGAGLGHLSRLSPIANALNRAGVQVHFAAADLSRAATVLDAAVTLHQTPRPGDVRPPDVPQYNYAALLVHAGWLDPACLDGLMRAWDALLASVRPDLVVCDYAPTALLATHGLPVRRCALGNGFDLAPLKSPFPPMSWWEPFDEAAAADIEAAVLDGANRVLHQRARPPLLRLADLFDCDWRAATTWPAFDVYPDRPSGDLDFVGLMEERVSDARPAWPNGSERVFAYLRGPGPFVVAAIAAAQRLGLSALVCAPGLDASRAAALSRLTVRVVPHVVAIEHALDGVSCVITHSGAGLGARAVATGRPIVLLPMYREQLMAAIRLRDWGVARHVLPDRLDDLETALAYICRDPLPSQEALKLSALLPARSDVCSRVVSKLLTLADA